jgi:hypothetical protein
MECKCGAWIRTSMRNCPRCGRTINLDAPRTSILPPPDRPEWRFRARSRSKPNSVAKGGQPRDAKKPSSRQTAQVNPPRLSNRVTRARTELRSFVQQHDSGVPSGDQTFQVVLEVSTLTGKQFTARVSKIFTLSASRTPGPDAQCRLESIRAFAKGAGLVELPKRASDPWYLFRYRRPW